MTPVERLSFPVGQTSNLLSLLKISVSHKLCARENGFGTISVLYQWQNTERERSFRRQRYLLGKQRKVNAILQKTKLNAHVVN